MALLFKRKLKTSLLGLLQAEVPSPGICRFAETDEARSSAGGTSHRRAAMDVRRTPFGTR